MAVVAAPAESTTVAATADPAALAERIFGAGVGAMDLATFYLGERLGLYRHLADSGPLTAAGLAARAGTDERYTREWLEHQAVGGVLAASAQPDGDRREYRLPEALVPAFLDPDDPFHLAGPMSRALVGIVLQLPRLLAAFRTGDGVAYEAFGADMREAIEAFNRPAFVTLLCQEWLPRMPDIDALLRRPGARVGELACGSGWAAISLARGYPGLRVDGYDLDEASIDRARANARAAGVEDRVAFHVRDAADDPAARGLELVCVFEALHDMARPVDALRTASAMAAPDGHVLVVDERAAEEFTAPGDDFERFLFGASVLFCLPTSRAEAPSAATGTAMRPRTVAAYAREAGFAGVDEAAIDYPFWRFYRLRRG